MESIDENFSQAEMKLTTQSLENLRLTSRWAQFLSILGFVGIGFMIIGAFGMFAMSSRISSLTRMYGGMDMSVIAIVYLIMALIYFFPVYYLYQFSVKMKKSVDTKDSMTFTEATTLLKNHYQFIGVVAIIVVSLYALLFIIGLGSAMM